MIDWIDVNTAKIKRMAFNAELKIMYVDFVESTLDVPFQGVTEDVFIAFSTADNVDNYYELFIKDQYSRVEITSENKIYCSL